MNEQTPGDIFALADEKLNADTEFQSSLEQMEDDEKAQALATKRQELINAEYAKQAEYARNMKLRAEKAEKAAKAGTPPEENPEQAPKKPESDEHLLTYKDTYALQEAKVHVDDVDEVVRYAKFSGKSVAEALADPTLTAIINTRVEQRKSAAAANKGGGKASTKKVSADELVQNASQGKVPERGSSESEELFWARRGGRPQ